MNCVTGLHEIKLSLQNGLGDDFPGYWTHLRNWICSSNSVDDLEFNLSPILKDNHELIQLHNLYLRTLLNAAFVGPPVKEDPPPDVHAQLQVQSQVNGDGITVQIPDESHIPAQPSAKSPTRRFRPIPRIRKRAFRRSQEFQQEQLEEEVGIEGNENETKEMVEMEVDEVRIPSPEEHVPLFEVFLEPASRYRKRKVSESESDDDDSEEADETDNEVEGDGIGSEEDAESAGEIENEEDDHPEQKEAEELQPDDGETEPMEYDASNNAELETNVTDVSTEIVGDANAEGEVGQEQEEDVQSNSEEDTEEEDTEEELEPGDDISELTTESSTEADTEESDLEQDTVPSAVPTKYLENLIESSAPRRGSVEIIPNVTHINKLLQSYIEKDPHLEYYFQPRKGPDQPFLTSNASIEGKMLNILWQYRLINIQKSAVDFIVEASQNHILTIIKTMIKRRKSYHVSEDGTSHSFGKPRENPYLLHSGDERFHEVNSTQKSDLDLPHVPPSVTEWDERERQVVYQIARRCTPDPPKYPTKIGPTELYEAIEANKGLIPSTDLKSKLMEKLLMKMRGYNEAVIDDDDKNNNSKVWESQEASSSQNGISLVNYEYDDSDEEEGELFPVCSY